MKRFDCGTLVPGCGWHTEADDEAEVVRRAVDHLKNAHQQHMVRENMVGEIKTRVYETKADAA